MTVGDPLPPFSTLYLRETVEILDRIDVAALEAVAAGLHDVRERSGRLFVLGVGGSAAHASHAVNDFRKICGLESYAPTDNVAELTARINDDGWDGSFAGWLAGSRLDADDALLVFSVGGGDRERNISVNLIRALDLALERGAAIFGIVGREGGYTAQVAHACVVIPPMVSDRVTPHTEGLCAVMWHLIVSHPLLQSNPTKWESTQ